MNRFCRLCIMSLALAAAATTMAGPGAWAGSGPNGGNVNSLSVSPANPDRIYLASAGGAFRSDDQGQTWLDIGTGLPVRRPWILATSASDADRVYHVAALLHRSDDGGASWQAPSPGWNSSWGAIAALEVDANDPDRLLATGQTGGLRRSTDGGANWERLDSPGQFDWYYRFVSLPNDPDTLVMIAVEAGSNEVGSFRSTDGGASWTAVDMGSFVLSSAAFAVAADGRLISYPNLVYSDDGGASWSPMALPPGMLLGVLAAAFVEDAPESWYLGGRNGLVRTDDGGANYSIVSSGMGPIGAGGYNAGVSSLALKPDDTDVLLIGSEFTGFYRSPDAGTTWQRRNSGLRGVSIRSLAINPTNSNVLYAGQGDAFGSIADNLWASFDGGGSWAPSNAGLEAGGLRALALDPNTAANPVTTVLYGVGWSTQIQDISLPPRLPSGGVFKSSSGGGSWNDIGTGFSVPPSGFSLLRAVVLDPSSGSGPQGDGPLQTLYIAGNGNITYADDGSGNIVPTVNRHYVYRSDDAGASWQPAADGLPISPWVNDLGAWFTTPIQLIIDPVDTDTLYVSTILSGPALINAGLTPNQPNGIFRSTDGGASWEHRSNGLPRYDETDPDASHWNTLAVALAPSNPSVLYAAVSPIDDFRPSYIYRTNNAGESWALASNGLPEDIDLRWIAVDPFDPEQVYVAGGGSADNPGSVFRSDDGGETWVSYSIGLPADSALVLAIDRNGPNPILHAGTNSGVYSIEQVPDDDIDGVPDDIEEGAPNGGDGNGDGIPDALQPDVASLLAPASGAGLRRGHSDYLTVELGAGSRGECARLMSVHALPAISFPIDTGYSYPYGLVRFEIPDCPSAGVRIIYHDLAKAGFLGEWVFRVYAPTTPGDLSTVRWQNLPGSSVDGKTWTFELADGEMGDLRPANGRILFQGGPALVLDNQIFADRFEQ